MRWFFIGVILFLMQICLCVKAQTPVEKGKAIKEKTLKEVVVTPDKITQHGDTLFYSVAGFREAHDRTIEDVIKHLPGVTVDDDGRIYYNGAPISHLYVDGKDLMGGSYSMVTKNLSANHVRSIKAWKKKIRLKSLRKVNFSDEVTLDLVLKDESRNKWTGSVEAGLGTPLQSSAELLRSAKLVGMFFGSSKQSISMYKHDNSGQNVAAEIRDLVPMGDTYEERSLLLAPNPGAWLSGRRNQFNDTHVLATNWLLSSNKNNSLRMQLSYLFDKSLSESSSRTVYTDLGDTLLQEQTSFLTGYRSELKGELKHVMRFSGFTLDHSLSGFADFNHSEGRYVLNGRESRQWFRPHRRGLHHYLGLKKVGGKKNLDVSSNLYYTFMPGRSLLIDGRSQCVDMKSLRWLTKAGGYLNLGMFGLEVDAGTRLVSQELFVSNADTTATQHYLETQFYVHPSVVFEKGLLNMSVGVDLYEQYQRLEKQKEHFFTASPQVSVELKPIQNLTWSSSWNRGTSLARSIQGLSTLAIYANSISRIKQSGKMDKFVHDIISSDVTYNVFPKMLFLRAEFSVSGNETLLLENSLKDGIHGSVQSQEKDRVWLYEVKGNASKRFRWKKLSVHVNAGHSWSTHPMLVGGERKPFKMRSDNVGLGFSVQPFAWFSLNAKTDLHRATQYTNAYESETTTSWQSNQLNLHFYLGKWQASLKNEWQTSSEKDVDSRCFSDFSLVYRTKVFEAGLDVHNLLGYDTVENYMLTTSMRVFSVSRLRPRELMVRVAFNL